MIADGTYPNAAAVFGEGGVAPIADACTGDAFPAGLGGLHYLTEPREANGRWTTGGGSRSSASIVLTGASEEERAEKKELRATGGPVPEVQSEDPPILKPVPGMTPHGPLSTVLMPIAPKGPSAQPSSVAASGSSESRVRTSLKLLTPSSPSSLLGEIAAPSTSGQEPSPRSHEDDEHSILRLFSSLFDGRQDETSALKDQLPPSISKHIIPGIIGPGPYAQQPIILKLGEEITTEMKEQNNTTGYTFGCHRCGTRDPGTISGDSILDHQLSTAINPRGWVRFGFPHCRTCSIKQGGHVTALKRALIREGLNP